MPQWLVIGVGPPSTSVPLSPQPPAHSWAPSLTSKQFIRVRSPAGCSSHAPFSPGTPPTPVPAPPHTQKFTYTVQFGADAPCNNKFTTGLPWKWLCQYSCELGVAEQLCRARTGAPRGCRGRGPQASDPIRAHYDPCIFDTIIHMLTRISQCLLKNLAIFMSLSGFVCSLFEWVGAL